MPWWVLLCLALMAWVVLVTGTYAAIEAIRLFRGLRASMGRLTHSSALLAAKTEALTAEMEAAGQSGARLQVGRTRLEVSLHDFRTLTWALQDVRRLVRIAQAFPRR